MKNIMKVLIYDFGQKTKYLPLFHSDGKREKIFYRYLTLIKTNISDVYSHKHMKTKIKSDADLPFEESIKYA